MGVYGSLNFLPRHDTLGNIPKFSIRQTSNLVLLSVLVLMSVLAPVLVRSPDRVLMLVLVRVHMRVRVWAREQAPDFFSCRVRESL